jgi:membrane protein
MFTFVILGSALGKNLKYYTKMLLKMTYIYFMVNLAIYIYRSIQYNFDFNRVRSGISIFGGNSAHFVFLMMLLILKKYGIQKKEYYIMLLMTVVNAIMFVSKGAILLTIGWILLDIINQKKTEILNWKVISTTACGILIIKIFLGDKISDFLSYLIERFTIWDNLYKNTGSLMGIRGQIADFTVSYIKSHISILLLGNGPATFRNINPWGYSNTHNLILDLTFDIGLVGIIIFFGICITIVLKNKNSIYFILCVLYATMEGVALFFIDSSSPIISGLTFMFIIMYYYDSKKQYIDESDKNVY